MKVASVFALLMLAACASGPPPLPPDLLSRLEAELKALPPGAEELFFLEDAERMARLREWRRGTSEDAEFLEKRMLGDQIPRVKRDFSRVARPPPPQAREKRVRVTFKDGRRIEGVLLEETPDTLRIKIKLGSILFHREDVTEVQSLSE